jgi:hypothetical protein
VSQVFSAAQLEKPLKEEQFLAAQVGPTKIAQYFWRREFSRQKLHYIFDGPNKPLKIPIFLAASPKTTEIISGSRKTIFFR